MHSLARGLARDFGHAVTVIRGLPPAARPTQEDSEGVTIHGLPIRRPYWLYDGRRRSPLSKLYWHWRDDLGHVPDGLERIIAGISADVIVLGNIVGLGHKVVSLARKLRIPSIQILHDFYYLCPRMTRFKNGRGCDRTCGSCAMLTRNRRQALVSVDSVVAVSSYLLRQFQKVGALPAQDSSAVIYNGVESLRVDALPAACGGTLRVGYLGRLSSEKGIEILIDAVRLAKAPMRLEIAGKGEASYMESLRDRLAGNMVLCGWVKPEEFLARQDVLVVPSLWGEPFGRVSVEAQMAGVPVIAANRGGLPETVDNGVSGFVVEPEPQEIADRLLTLAQQPGTLTTMKSAASSHGSNYCEADMLKAFDRHISELLAQ